MPGKGDNLNSVIADANIEHLGNVIATITPKGAVHPSTATACAEGMFRKDKYEAGGVLANLPVFVFKTGTIKDPLTQLVLTPKKDDQLTIRDEDFTVGEAEVESADMTRLVLQDKLA